ncbi:MAG: VCBS repeat-containing protein, partial [Chitinophagaceae bacterium]|nr:VCBS repeat-containing protein [Chitinophagaceae bacterium]
MMTDFDDVQVGDFNGDGKSDLLLHKKTGSPNFEVAYSTGTGFNRVSLSLPYVRTCSYGAGDQFFVADYNNDGKSDILVMNRYCDAYYFFKTKFTAYFSCGMQFAASRSLEYTGLVHPDIQPIVMDANGDGVPELCFQSSASPNLQFLSCETKPTAHLLQKVTDGLNRTTEFAYEPLTKGTGIGATDFYTKGSGETYPVNNAQYPLFVATSVKSPDGIGGSSIVSYKYQNLLVHRGGRGILGFEKVKSVSNSADVRTESVYELNRDFYTPWLKTSKSFLNSTGEALSQADNTMAFTRIGSSYRYKQELRSTTAQDLLMGTTTVVNDTFDVNGNVSGSGSVTTGGVSFSRAQSITYVATGGSLFPNRPLEIRETVQRGTQPAVSTKKKYTYNSRGLLTQLVDGPDAIGAPALSYTRSIYDYDLYGNIKLSDKESYFPTPTDPETKYVYDGFGRFILSEENALGHKKEYTTHPFWGKPLTEKGVNGLSSTYTYNDWGKLTASSIPTGPGTSYTVTYTDAWDPGPNKLYSATVSDPSAPDITTWYDALDRPVKTRQESFNGTWLNAVLTYDAKGNVATASRKYKDLEGPVLTTNTYNKYNQLSSASDVYGTTEYTYLHGGGYRTTTTKLPDGKIKVVKEDASGKVIESKNGIGGTVVFEYDSRGNEISAGFKGAFAGVITIPVRKEYDYTGQLKKLIDLDAGTSTYNYNPMGQLTGQTDPAGKVTTYEYDKLGNVVKKYVGSDYEYTYMYYGPDKDYRLASEKVVSTADGTIEDTYDYAVGGGLSQHIKNTNGLQLKKTFGYDAYNRPLNTAFPASASGTGSGFAIRNHYDANGFLRRISTDFGGPAKTLYELDDMNADGQVTAFKRVDAMPASISYDNRLPTVFYTSGMQDLRTVYNLQNGNVSNRQDHFMVPTNPKEFFTYDALDRLT